MTGWLVREPTWEVPLVGAWTPPTLRRFPAALLARLSYAVLDEADHASVSFAVSPWPSVDLLGRVRHAVDRVTEASVPLDDWVALLAERGLPEPARTRPPRIGDTYAVLAAGPGRAWSRRLVGPVVDVTEDARAAARAAFYGAVATPLEGAEAVVRTAADAARPLAVPAAWREAAR